MSQTQDSVSFPEAVSAVSPLNGQAIDGGPQPKPRRERKWRRDFDKDAHRHFACPNKNCDHEAWTEARQLQHLGKELARVVYELARVDPENPVVVLHAGGVVLRDLTDDQCRSAGAEYWTYRKAGDAGPADVPLDLRLRRREYERRRLAGILTPAGPRPLVEHCQRGHLFTEENTYVSPRTGQRVCRECQRLRGPAQRARDKARMDADPEFRERRREIKRRSVAAHPETYERSKERHQARYAADPEFRERQLAKNRQEPLPERACEFCGELFAPNRSDKRFCSRRCKSKGRQR